MNNKPVDDIKEALQALIKYHEQQVAKYQEQLREHINRYNLNK